MLLKGLVIGFMKGEFSEIAPYIQSFIPQINNWAICDSFCANLKITKKNKEEMLQIITENLNSTEEYHLRFAIVTLMDFYIDEEYIDYVLKVVSSVKSDYYYVKMAVAWAFSVCYVKFKTKTEITLETSDLDDFVYKKSWQKIRELRRVPKN